MRTLVLDCSTEACSAALFEGTKLLDGRYELLGRGHAERLVPMIGELPGRGKAPRIVAGLGPGSFTGVRIAIATARALALAWGSETFGFPTLALIAAMARDQLGKVPVAVAMTGGHGEWFLEHFGPNGQSTRALASLPPDRATAVTHAQVVTGNRASELVEQRGNGTAIALLPDARAFGLLPAVMLSASLNPIYGRGPDAKLPGVVA